MPRVKATETTAAIDPFLRCVGEKLEPAITTPNLWLFIVKDDDDRTAAMKFAETRMLEFDIMHSTYIPSKVEMLTTSQLLARLQTCHSYSCSSGGTHMLMKLAGE